MKTLTIVRHAKSSWDDQSLADQDRPLSERGRRDAPLMGRRIAAAGIRPSLIISSPAVRAWTTARAIAQELGYPFEFLHSEADLYMASRRDIVAVLGTQDNKFNNLMLVGHNPGLTDFANFLVPGITNNLPTAGVLSVSIDQDDWALKPHPATELKLFDSPKRAHGSSSRGARQP